MRKNYGFTISELLIVLMIMGLLTAFMTNAFKNSTNNSKKVLFKKAYSVVERIIYDIVNDDELYPDAGSKVGFANMDNIVYNGNDFSGPTKFCNIFATKVNTISKTAKCTAKNPNWVSNFTDWSNPDFITSDGIVWYMPVYDFSVNNKNSHAILIDVNGIKNQPNCSFDENICPEPDRFTIFFTNEGKIYVEDKRAQEYLSANT